MRRRRFLKQATAAGVAFSILPAYAAPKSKNSKRNDALPPSERINLAVIGCTHKGGGNGRAAVGSGMVNCVALCDVVKSRAEEFKALHGPEHRHHDTVKDARVFDDFRQMFDQMGDQIDACLVSTPDHTHFPISMHAMSMGIHVYCEKPLAHTFEECELLMKAEKKFKVACQMGNQGHSGTQRVQFDEWVKSGLIKNVRRVDAAMNSGRRWHKWGQVTAFPPEEPMPEGMNWDAWTGTAPMHPYSTKYDPGNWRGWYDFGNGAFGDWGPHTLDSVHRFLKLGLPHEIRADMLEGQNDFIYPLATTIVFDFKARGEGFPAMAINWYDGVKNYMPRPKELGAEREVLRKGKIIYGEDLVFMGGTHSDPLRIIPETKMREMGPSLPELPEPATSKVHMVNFLNAAKGQEECNSKFSVSAPLTQMFMLGCIAQRLGGTLAFDAEKKQITNNRRANELLTGHAPRKGWEQYYELV